ncbi:MAG: AAA family ATPase [Candidatus Gastranaerophilales bacterium]|nr:AAA family ATPase [Candidatus Gastranaerophilales bacterium]
MTSTIAIIGKSGSGKTTVARAFLEVLKKKNKNSSILLVDNDLSLELSDSFGIKSKNTIYGIKSGKHEYKTGIPEGMSKQEYIEWALEDIIISLDENIDMISSWFVTPKDCHCPSTKLMRDSVTKLIDRYDFVIFDCEYDLKYLNLLVDCSVDVALIVAPCTKDGVVLASKVANSSKKYTPNGQIGVVLNKVNKDYLHKAILLLHDFELDLIGTIQNFDELNMESISESIENFYARLNLPRADFD